MGVVLVTSEVGGGIGSGRQRTGRGSGCGFSGIRGHGKQCQRTGRGSGCVFSDVRELGGTVGVVLVASSGIRRGLCELLGNLWDVSGVACGIDIIRFCRDAIFYLTYTFRT